MRINWTHLDSLYCVFCQSERNKSTFRTCLCADHGGKTCCRQMVQVRKILWFSYSATRLALECKNFRRNRIVHVCFPFNFSLWFADYIIRVCPQVAVLFMLIPSADCQPLRPWILCPKPAAWFFGFCQFVSLSLLTDWSRRYSTRGTKIVLNFSHAIEIHDHWKEIRSHVFRSTQSHDW